ncbi:WAT1-related protein At4g08300-like [Gastrolobium bilobum]|uniref:WAT1-related protein At4g08300-like n=1 Tax=Gastrolobium bilobum TaxID=150636 RepID=UPI002AB25BF2|nr:WAT1-related protein At4g08300-like [Gastrolobium bilobum]
MSNKERAFGVMYWKFMPHLFMVLVQVALAFLYVLVEASFNNGMNPHVFVTYRYAVGGIVVLPFAYFLEREARSKLTMAMFMELFFLSLFGISLGPNMFFASLEYTTPSFVASMINTISSLTFMIAVAFRLEAVDVKSPRGLAKIFGTVLSLTGAVIMTLYKGHTIESLQGTPFHIRDKLGHNNWIKGSILTVASCISWSLWYILQAIIVKKYPAHLSLTAWINCMGAAQSAAFTVLVQHKPRAWSITSSFELCCILYAGVICGGLITFIQIWTTEHKGPIFVSMFNPVGTTLVAIIAYFVLGEQLHMGSILGVGIVIIGLYLLSWGKESDQNYKKPQQSFPTDVEQKECGTNIKTSAEEEKDYGPEYSGLQRKGVLRTHSGTYSIVRI